VNPDLLESLGNFDERDLRRTMLRAITLVAVLTAVAAPFVWWKLGWQSMVLLVVGSAISASGLWEWLRLMTSLMAQMDAGKATQGPGKGRSVGLVVAGFLLRLVIVVAVLYGSLKLLEGSVAALAAGLGLGIVALTIEGLRLVKSWTGAPNR
jgi:hypothetical protein